MVCYFTEVIGIMSEMSVNSLLEGLCLTVGIAPVTLDEKKSCGLMFDSVPVQFVYDDRGRTMRIDSVVGDLSEKFKNEMIADLLDANYVYKGTNGATFGVDNDTGKVLLSLSEEPGDMTQPIFEEKLERFINVAEFWIDILADYNGPLDLNELEKSSFAPKEEPPPVGIRV